MALAKEQFADGRAKAVILARHDVAADSVSAVPLADALDAPVLLTQPTTLHPATAKEIARALPKGGKVIIMGGEVAVSAAVQRQLEASGYAIERIAGVNRAATAVVTAERLAKDNKAKTVVLVDGQDWQSDLIAGPVAAKVDGVTLLTNGKAMASETRAYLAKASAPVIAIGATAQTAGNVRDAVTAADATALSLAVANRFFDQPKAVGLATTETFADALAGGAHVARHDAPMLLTPPAGDSRLTQWVTGAPTVKQVFVYGGPQAVREDVVRALTTK